ncbi:glycoside hydrolase superfamily [Lineolata rhizophorae]|uniref:Glycoside hydrolase superfamily n=1 Tax=Lineolata rhizophorae TaxID=578093 RepID=A0A6A6NW69_9PEZI|nr:glycoside hydrolase superfamily [Lineolata rhizophorae]
MAPPDGVDATAPVSAEDFHRYRWGQGGNFGAVFVLEKWMAGSMFPDAGDGQTSELEAARIWTDREGLEGARVRFERHWRDMVKDERIEYLVNTARCTLVRLPVGFWTCGPQFCQGTPFEPYGMVWVNAWATVKSLVARLADNGISTLVDLHGLPGGANDGEHSGTNIKQALLWQDRRHWHHSVAALEFMAHDLRGVPGVAGLQVCNETCYDARGMYDFYDEAIAAISRADSGLPIVISDGWDLPRAADYAMHKNSLFSGVPNPTIIDTHYYWCFAPKDTSKSPQEVIDDVGNKLSELDGREGDVTTRGAVQVFVGEYSVVMAESTWQKVDGSERDEYTKRFGQAQQARWQSRAAGSTFWSFTVEWYPGGGWGYAAQINSGALPVPPHLTLPADEVRARLARADAERQPRLDKAYADHVGWWGRDGFEHWRFQRGWDVGFADARAFFGWRSAGGFAQAAAGGASEGADTIGAREVWVRKRLLDSGSRKEKFVWEYEHGLRKGMSDFYELVGC